MYAWVGNSYVSILVSKFWFLLISFVLLFSRRLGCESMSSQSKQHPYDASIRQLNQHVQGLVYGVYMEFGVFLRPSDVRRPKRRDKLRGTILFISIRTSTSSLGTVDGAVPPAPRLCGFTHTRYTYGRYSIEYPRSNSVRTMYGFTVLTLC